MQEKDLRVIEKFKSLVSQKVKVLELRVFGSRARATQVLNQTLMCLSL